MIKLMTNIFSPIYCLHDMAGRLMSWRWTTINQALITSSHLPTIIDTFQLSIFLGKYVVVRVEANLRYFFLFFLFWPVYIYLFIGSGYETSKLLYYVIFLFQCPKTMAFTYTITNIDVLPLLCGLCYCCWLVDDHCILLLPVPSQETERSCICVGGYLASVASKL